MLHGGQAAQEGRLSGGRHGHHRQRQHLQQHHQQLPRAPGRPRLPHRDGRACWAPSQRPGELRAVRLLRRSVWDDSVTLADLRQQLDSAVSQEDYELAARIRDALQQRQTDAKLAIEDANARFYDAFRSGNIREMDAVWGQGEHVQVIHPGAACIAGRAMVMESWAAILKGVRPNAFKIALEDVRVFALSDSQGLVTCVEVVDADDSRGRTVATNLFELQEGKWLVTLHHGSPLMRFR